MVKTLELAVSRAAALPDEAQEQLGRELLERIDAMAGLRAAIAEGLRELDRGEGEDASGLRRFARNDISECHCEERSDEAISAV